MKINENEKQVLKQLAAQMAEIAHHPSQQKKKQEWILHNSMQKKLPRVLAFAENSWREIITEEMLQTQHPLLRSAERSLRQSIFHYNNFKDDAYFEPYYRMKMSFDDHFDWGMGAKKEHAKQNGGAYKMVPVLKTQEDFERMKEKSHAWVFDDQASGQNQDILQEIFGDYLEVRPSIPYYTSSIIFQLVPLYGLTELMMDLVMRPEFIGQILEYMKNELLKAFVQLEKDGRIKTNNNEQFLPSGSIGLTDQLKEEKNGESYTLKDLWGFADTQEFTDVSPEMWREFVFPHQRQLLSHFGLVSYACCEKMDAKFDDVLLIPGIRKVSVSPWSNTQIAAEKLRNKAIYCRKVNPSPIIYGAGKKEILAEIENLLCVAKGNHLEIVLKDLHTCNNNPGLISSWVDAAQSLCK